MQAPATHCIDLFCSTAIIRVLVLYVACAADAPRLYKSPDCWLSQSLCAVESNRVICSPWKNAVQRHAKRGRGRKATRQHSLLEKFDASFSPAAERQIVYTACCKNAQGQSRVKRLLGWKLRLQKSGRLKRLFTEASAHSTAFKNFPHSCVRGEMMHMRKACCFGLPPKLTSWVAGS